MTICYIAKTMIRIIFLESESIAAPAELKKAVTAKGEVAKKEPPAAGAVGGDGATQPQLRRERSHLEQVTAPFLLAVWKINDNY